MNLDIISIIHKFNSVPVGMKAAIAFTVSTFIIKGIAFLVTPIFTRIMDTAQYGVVATFNSWQTILEVFALLGLTSAGVFNVGLNEYKENRDQYISSLLVLCNFVTVIVFGTIYILCWLEMLVLNLPGNLIFLMFLSFLFSPAQVFWITRQRYEYKYKLPSLVTIITALVSQIISAYCVCNILCYEAAEVKLWSSSLILLLCNVPIYLYLIKKGKTLFDKGIWVNTLYFALPLLPHYLSQHMMAGFDKILISEICSQSEVGIYSLMTTVGMIGTFVWTAINASLTPYTFENINNNSLRNINELTIKLLLFYSLICCYLALFAPEILYILAPKEYMVGIYVVPPMVIVAFLGALYNIFANIEFYHKATRVIALATVVASVVNVVTNYTMIPIWGYISAAYSMLLANVILIIIHYFGYRKCQKTRIYDDKKIIYIFSFTFVICMACNILYSDTLIRYTVIALITMYFISKRNLVIETFRNRL